MKEYLRQFFVEPLAAQKKWLGVAISSLILLSAAQSLFVVLVGPFLKALFSSAGSTLSLCSLVPRNTPVPAALCDVTMTSGQLVIWLPVAIVVAGWVKSVGSYMFLYSQEVLATAVAQNYRLKLFQLIIHQSFANFRRKSVGEWMSTIMNDVSVIQGRFSDVTTSFVRDLVLVLAALGAIFFINWRAGLAVTAMVPFGAAILGRAAVRIAWYSEQFQRRLAATAGLFLNIRSRFAMIRAQHGEELEFTRFDVILRDYYRMIRRSLVLRSTMGPGMEFFGFCVFAGFVSYLTRSGELAAGKPLAAEGIQLVVALGLLLRPMRNIGEQFTKLQEIRGALRTGYETWSEVVQGTTASQAIVPHDVGGMTEEFVINALDISYGKGARVQIQSLRFAKGKAYAVIGPSGAGKSSFVRVLAGLVEPERYEGLPSLNATRNQVAFVSQEPFFFQGSLRENLLYGLNAKDVSDERILEALRLVNINLELLGNGDDLKAGLDRPYKGLVGGVSGGQLQRLVIAREIMRHKDIWILDEPTSAIDARSERDITERLVEQAKSRGKILLVVTHRLQWLSLFDEIQFFEDGRCLATGSLNALLGNERIRKFIEGPETQSHLG